MCLAKECLRAFIGKIHFDACVDVLKAAWSLREKTTFKGLQSLLQHRVKLFRFCHRLSALSLERFSTFLLRNLMKTYQSCLLVTKGLLKITTLLWKISSPLANSVKYQLLLLKKIIDFWKKQNSSSANELKDKQSK
jgi:hypothetical protein